MVGSSPLARGLLERLATQVGDGRIIPARAGFTQVMVVRRDNQVDHPRSRGVYIPESPLVILRTGSSPLARGLRRDLLMSHLRSGIIPGVYCL